MSQEEQEGQLLERAVTGDEAAVEHLMMQHHHRLSAAVGRMLPGDLQGVIAVDDVLQEAYVIVFREIRSFLPRGPGSFYAWLEKIAENRLFDMIKAQRAAKRGGGRERVEAPVNPATGSAVEWLGMLAVNERTPSQSAAIREAVAKVQLAMEGLKEDYRQALRLRYIDGLPVAEAAVRMNRTEGALCLLCHRGLRQMQEALGSSAQFFSSSA
ncbi:MAG TPA: RNA polymerase sigma factor [Phycisphaerae bacterium]|nr:RNA polymerase sigma factor [Phycisphaerae bacterium]